MACALAPGVSRDLWLAPPNTSDGVMSWTWSVDMQSWIGFPEGRPSNRSNGTLAWVARWNCWVVFLGFGAGEGKGAKGEGKGEGKKGKKGAKGKGTDKGKKGVGKCRV